MKFIIKKVLLIFLCFILLTLTGCWDNQDLSELGIVVGLGLDKVEDDQIEITVQVIKPNVIESRNQGSMISPTNNISARGKTVFEANRNLLTKIGKVLFYGHIQLTIIGEELAKDGISDVLDLFSRVHEIDKRETVLISKGITPRELFNIEPTQSPIFTLEAVSTIKNNKKLSSIRVLTLYDLIANANILDANAIIGKIETSNKTKNLVSSDLNFTGAAVLKNNKLIGWLSPTESSAFSLLDNKFKNSAFVVKNPQNPEKNLTIEVTNSQTKKSIYLKNNKPVIHVQIDAQGRLVEQYGSGDLATTTSIKKVQKEIEKYLEKIIMQLIIKAQKDYKTDIFGLETLAHKKNFEFWKSNKYDWENTFSNMNIDIDVKFNLKNLGFIKKHK